MQHVVDPKPVPTDIIRTPTTGPKPANTLAFIRCRASGADIGVTDTDLQRFEVEFTTKFQIDGYLQAKHDWYLANTLVSATGMIRLANAVDDIAFVMALDSVEPFIDLHGVLGFNCQFGLQTDSDPIDLGIDLCAYVLLFEPQAERPPSGKQRQIWKYSSYTEDSALTQIPYKSIGGFSKLIVNTARPPRSETGKDSYPHDPSCAKR